MVKNLLRSLLLVCAALLPVLSHAQTLSAFVDRTNITINDVITFTLRLDVSLGNTRPQFTGLNQNFEQVGGISSRSTYTNTNGNVQAWTEYSLMLRPLTTGTLTIPSMRVGNDTTQPIQITVTDAATDSNNSDEIFLRTSISKTESFVQEQLLFTIKIYYSIGFDQGAQLTPPQIENAVVQQLGSDNSFQEVVNGISYNVTERRYVIFPQQSGELNIPPIYFNATVGRRGGINRFFNTRTVVRDISLATEALKINVKAYPEEFDGKTWLPASNLQLTETWNGNFENLNVGEAITRNVTIEATGLSSSLLPAVEFPALAGLRFYPDQPVREDSANTEGVLGKRSESTAIVPSQAGEFVLPEVQLPWWNTQTNTLELATLPARTLTILPPVDAPDATSVTPTTAPDASTATLPGSGGAVTTVASNPFWMITTGIFAALWAVTALLLLKSRQHLVNAETYGAVVKPQSRTAAVNASNNRVEPAALASASASLQVLKTACDNKALADVRKAVLKWGQSALQDSSVSSLSQLSRTCNNATLSEWLSKLDQALYSNSAAQAFDCAGLYQCVAQLHKQGFTKSSDANQYALRPLYQ
jgi:hypothetical protein